MIPRIAFLVFAPLKRRREDNSFDGNGNIGAKVIEDVLRRRGLEVGYCAPETAHKWDIVLVSMTSTNDMIAYYQNVSLRPEWQPCARRFKVICGGFGMQNPRAVRHYVDYCVFGRAEEHIADTVTTIANGGCPDHESVMKMPEITRAVMAQAEQLYPHPVEGWEEAFTGCPHKCKFCHFTFARRHQGKEEIYSQSTLTGGGSPEVTWDQLLDYPKKAGRIRAAIDGFSERLRFIYGKRITNDEIIAGIESLGSYEGTTTLMIYNIANMPTETDGDREELYTTLRRAKPKHRVIVVLQSTPFRPSILTPMQWEAASLYPDWSKQRTQVIVDRENLRAMHSFTLETPWSHLCSLAIERHNGSEGHDKAFHAICHAPKLQSGTAAEKLMRFERNFQLTDYLREYAYDEPHPSDFLDGYIPRETLVKIAVKMRKQATGALPVRYAKHGTGI